MMGESSVSSFTNRARRVSALETTGALAATGAVLLMMPGQSESEALADWEAANGKSEGEPTFIYLVGLKPLP